MSLHVDWPQYNTLVERLASDERLDPEWGVALPLALAAAGPYVGGDENTFFATNLSPALLVNGTNVLAVEIHQVNLTSSDLSFDLELVGLGNSPPMSVYLQALASRLMNTCSRRLGSAWTHTGASGPRVLRRCLR